MKGLLSYEIIYVCGDDKLCFCLLFFFVLVLWRHECIEGILCIIALWVVLVYLVLYGTLGHAEEFHHIVNQKEEIRSSGRKLLHTK